MSTLSLKEAAAIAGKSPRRLRQMVEEGRLKASRAMARGVSVYVFQREDLDAYLAQPDGRRRARPLAKSTRKAKPVPQVLAEPVVLPEPSIRAEAPPQRFQTVPLLSDHKPVIRSGAFDFRKHQRHGRF